MAPATRRVPLANLTAIEKWVNHHNVREVLRQLEDSAPRLDNASPSVVLRNAVDRDWLAALNRSGLCECVEEIPSFQREDALLSAITYCETALERFEEELKARRRE